MENYGSLLQNIENTTKEKYTIEDTYKEINDMNFSDDFLHLKKHINEKLAKTDFLIIAENKTCVYTIEKNYFNLCQVSQYLSNEVFLVYNLYQLVKDTFYLKT
ncbi:hypothetical protein CDIK_0203 [Cucumispora dikerogammari]|nr:hypothetical protein CDIK_0203 [Cucumispora dikerogammari]